jgi:uncharacterized delta-60 repeat protein
MKKYLFVMLLPVNMVYAQPGTLDTTFNLTGSGANNVVFTTSIQSDGKIIVGGAFTTINGQTKNRIVRLNTDGSLDTTFNPTGSGANYSVYTTSIQSDGKIIIGGTFTVINGQPKSHIARLNTDGTLDATFNPTGSGANDYVPTTSIQSDGKIIIGGDFTVVNGQTKNRIARLNTDGTLDTTFNPTGSGANDNVFTTSIQSDGKIIIGGDFTVVNGQTKNRIARLNTDGTLDATFNPTGSGANDGVFTTSIQSDGKIIIGGWFTVVNGQTIYRIARLNTDGTLDATFNLTGSGPSLGVLTTSIQSDGKIIIGGDFYYFNGQSEHYVTRLNTDGSLDTTFNPTGMGAGDAVNTTSIQSDGKIIIGGDFSSYNATSRTFIARLNGDNITSVEEIIKDNLVSLFPNPANTTIQLKLSQNENGTVELWNVMGERVYTENISNESKKEIDIKNISNGIYFVKVFDGEKSYCKKLIIEHD